MKNLRFLTLQSAMLVVVSPLVAQDFAIVATEHGYLIDARDQVVQTVDYLTPMRVVSKQNDFLAVTSPANGTLRIHKAQVHLLSTFSFLDQKDSETFSAILRLVRDADRANADEDPELADETLKKALDRLDDDDLRDTPLRAWLMSQRAFLEYPDGKTSRALRLLDKADASLATLGAEGNLLAAEVKNIRGLFAVESGNLDDAKRLFMKAMTITIRKLGARHLDVAAYQDNLSLALEAEGELDLAIAAVRKAQQLRQAALPASAIELVQTEAELSKLYLANRQFTQANTSARTVLQSGQAYHPDDHYMIGRAQYQIADIYSAQKNNEEAARWYDLSSVEFDKATAKSDAVVAALDEAAKAESELEKRAADRAMRLAERGVTDTTAAPLKAAVTSVNYTMVLAPTERLLVTTQRTSLMDGTKVLDSIPAGTRLWSTEKRGEWRRVYYASAAKSGWVAESKTDDVMRQLFLKSTAEINARHAGTSKAGEVSRELMTRYPAAMKLFNSRNYNAAIPELEELIEKYAELAGDDDVAAASARSTLATAYFLNRQYVKCRKLLEAALPLQRAAMGSDHPRIAAELSRLAGLLSRIGDVPGMLKCHEEALRIAEAKFAPGDPRLTGLRMSLAQTLVKMGDQQRATSIFTTLLETEAKQYDGVTPVMPTARLGLAKIKSAAGNFQQAVTLLRQAVNEYVVLGEGYRFQRRDTLFELSRNLVLLGEVEEGRQTLDRAEQLLSDQENSHPDWNITLKFARANLAALDGDVPLALQLTEQCMELLRSSYREDNVLFRELHSLRGSLNVAAENIVDATADFDRARRLAHTFIVNTLADQPVTSQVNYIRFTDNRSLHSALGMAKKADNRPDSLAKTATWLLNSKNLANELAARDGQIRKLLTRQKDVDNYERWLDVRRRLVTLPKLTAEEAANQELRNVESELQDQEQRTYAYLPSNAQALISNQRNGWVLVEDIRKQLRADEVYIDIMRLNLRPDDEANGSLRTVSSRINHYVAWIIPVAGGGNIRVVNLGKADEIDSEAISPMLTELERALAKRQLIGDEEATQHLRRISSSVTDAIWKPLASLLAPTVKRLILCPDSKLWRVPWSSLPTGDDRYLIEDFEIRFVSSGRSLLAKGQETSGLTSPVILADPDYGSPDANRVDGFSKDQLRSFTGGQLQPFDTSFLRDALPETIAPLPGTAHEARTIRPELDTWSGSTSQVLLRDQASEAEFRRVHRPHTLFIGTHGFFFPEVKDNAGDSFSVSGTQVRIDVSQKSAINPLRRCGLLLAGCSQRSIVEADSPLDGILTGEEIVAQDLRGTRLVVLSACETGIGDLLDGQGVAGLRQSIQLAGAESVVSTLWSIEDRETAALMSAFFRNLAKGQNRSEALRQAQLSRIETRRERFGAAHPFFWAAFTLTGQR